MDQIVDITLSKIEQAEDCYYRLVLLVAPSGCGKTKVVHEISKRLSIPIINLNLELSRSLLELTEKERALHSQEKFQEIINQEEGDIILLDNIELLFSSQLKLDPLRLLQMVSRDRTIVSTWSGTLENDHLIYAEPKHHEYYRKPVEDTLIVSL